MRDVPVGEPLDVGRQIGVGLEAVAPPAIRASTKPRPSAA